MQMVESRQSDRVRCFLRAKIVFNNRNSTFDCIVRNFSRTGAKIEVNNSHSIPADFDLEIPQKGKTYRAHILWRDLEAMGVEFIQKAGANEPQETPALTIDRLERENRRLRSAVAALTKRLEDLGQAVDAVP